MAGGVGGPTPSTWMVRSRRRAEDRRNLGLGDVGATCTPSPPPPRGLRARVDAPHGVSVEIRHPQRAERPDDIGVGLGPGQLEELVYLPARRIDAVDRPVV